MHDWLRVTERTLMVEMAVVGSVLAALFLVFMQVPQPAWLPAVILWGATLGFIVYRIMVASRTPIARAPTDRLSTHDWAEFGRSRDEDEGDMDLGKPVIVGVAQDRLEASPEQESPVETDDSPVVLGSAEGIDDLRATLFDVPGVAGTRDAFEKMRVLTDEEYQVALSETELFPTVDAERADRRGTAPTIATDAISVDPDEADTLDTRGERAPTLDEETWRRLRDPDGGSSDER